MKRENNTPPNHGGQIFSRGSGGGETKTSEMEKVVCAKQDNHWRIRELGKWLSVREREAGSLGFDPKHCCYKQAPPPQKKNKNGLDD